MRTFILVLALGALLGGCARPGGAGGVVPGVGLPSGAVAGAIAAEAAVTLRCPQSAIELAVLMASRAGFDLTVGSQLGDQERAIVQAARVATDQACGIGAVAAPIEA